MRERPFSYKALFAVVYTTSVSSVYFALGVVAHRANGLTPAVFLVAGLFFGLTAMTYAEGASLHPERGGSAVFARYASDAQSFQEGGESHFEILHMAASDGIAYWVGFQHASALFKGSPNAIPMKLRITEVFRREGDEWKLIHRHADSLAEEKKQ